MVFLFQVIENCKSILPVPLYSIDLAASYYYLFPKIKKELRSRNFDSDDDIIAFLGHFHL